jgi:TrmH family RNA methyltransferase
MSAPLVATNSRVKEARKLSRRSVRTERRLFLAVGPKAVEGALGATTHDGEPCVVEVFATTDAVERYDDLLRGVDDVVLVDDRAMAALSDSVSPAGVVAVCRFVDVPLAQLLERSSPPLVVCADVRDPGNAGTIIRTADAVGAGGVVLTGHSVDPHNPKTVRASVGSLFHLPVAVEPDTALAVQRVRAAGMDVLAADGAGELDLFEIDEVLADDVAWLFGNEAWGLPDEVAALADHRVRIPIAGRAESLNLSTAAAVCLYATARAQHR